jgi:hypothetical protein
MAGGVFHIDRALIGDNSKLHSLFTVLLYRQSSANKIKTCRNDGCQSIPIIPRDRARDPDRAIDHVTLSRRLIPKALKTI